MKVLNTFDRKIVLNQKELHKLEALFDSNYLHKKLKKVFCVIMFIMILFEFSLVLLLTSLAF